MKKLLFIIPLFLTLHAFCQIPPEGLIGYWPFNGNSLDESGNNHHAINGWKYPVNYTTDRFGAANAAYSADSTRLQVLYSPAFDFQTGDKFSISAWVYYPVKHGFAGNILVRYPSYGIFLEDSARYFLIPGGFGKIGFEANKWYHLAYVYDGDSISTLINGKRDLRVKARINKVTEDLYIGSMHHPKLGGKLDDIAMYNRALSISEINKLYSAAPTAVSETINNSNTVSIVRDNSGNYQVRANTPIENIKVYNVNGSLVKESSNSSVSGLPAGFYIFYISTKEGVVKSKLVVN